MFILITNCVVSGMVFSTTEVCLLTCGAVNGFRERRFNSEAVQSIVSPGLRSVSDQPWTNTIPWDSVGVMVEVKILHGFECVSLISWANVCGGWGDVVGRTAGTEFWCCCTSCE